MTITFPEGVEGEGNLKVAFVPALADPASPTDIELEAGVDLSCYITGDGFQPGGEQEERTDRRLCSRQVFGVPGAITYTIGEITYVYDPQDMEDIGGENEAYVTLAPGTTGFLAVRWGLAYEEAWADTQIVDIYSTIMGAQFKNPPATGGAGGGGGGGTSKLTVRQTPYVSGPANLDVAVAAGV